MVKYLQKLRKLLIDNGKKNICTSCKKSKPIWGGKMNLKNEYIKIN